MRICLFTPTFYPAVGGAEHDADVIARGLTGRGHLVVVLARRIPGTIPELPYPVLTYRRPPRQHWWPELLTIPLLRAHRRYRFDTVLALYSYPNGYAASLVKARMRCALVMAPQGADLYAGYHELEKPRVADVIRRGYRSADRIICLSAHMRHRLHEVVGEPLPPTEVVYNGIDVARHDASIDRARRDISNPLVTGPFVLHLARVNAVKGQDTAVRALRLIADEMRSRGMRYVFVGDGNAMPALRELIRDQGVEDVALVLGTRTGLEKYWLLANALFFVSTSREEAFGNVVIEAMASGLPMLASDIPVHHELIAQRAWGELFRVDDPRDMAEKLRAWIDRDLTPYRARARAVRDDFSLQHMIDGYERICLMDRNPD